MISQDIEQYLKNLRSVKISYPYGKELAFYGIENEIFAIVETNKKPLRLSLLCDQQLAKILKDRYDEVMSGYKLNKEKWITIVSSGQLDDDQIKDLINHSYNIAQQNLASSI